MGIQSLKAQVASSMLDFSTGNKKAGSIQVKTYLFDCLLAERGA